MSSLAGDNDNAAIDAVKSTTGAATATTPAAFTEQSSSSSSNSIAPPPTSTSTDASSTSDSAPASTAAAVAPPVRMKRVRKRSHLRATGADVGGGEVTEEQGEKKEGDSSPTDGNGAQKLEAIRLLQKLRTKSSSVLTLGEGALHLPDAQMMAASAAAASSAAAAASSSSAAAAPVLGKEFGAEGKDAQTALIEEQMEKYIQEQMEKRRAMRQPQQKKQEEQQASSSSSAPALNESSLFETPAHLQIAPTQSREEAEESGERWLTGIAECQLAIKDKMKNIERTEAAKARLMAEQAARRSTGGVLPANFNANFRLHKKEWDSRRREEFRVWADAQNRAQALAQGLPPPPPSMPHRRDEIEADPYSRAAVNKLPGFLAGGEHEHGHGQRRDYVPRAPPADGSRRINPQRAAGVPMASDDRIVDRFIKRFKYK